MRLQRKQYSTKPEDLNEVTGRQLAAARAADAAWRAEQHGIWARRVWRARRVEVGIHRYLGIAYPVAIYGIWAVLAVTVYYKRPIYWLFYAWLGIIASVLLGLAAMFLASAAQRRIRRAAKGEGVDLGA